MSTPEPPSPAEPSSAAPNPPESSSAASGPADPHPNGQPQDGPLPAGLTPDGPTVIRTQNERLSDGVNRCPKCGSTDIQQRPSTGMLVCLFCRYEWSEAQIEADIAGDGDLSSLRGTTIASGASDIDPSVAGVLTLKCGGCGSEVVVNTAESMSARCHWCRHMLTVNDQVPNGAVPDAVLPFSISHEQAVQRITEFAGKRRTFAHKRFKREFTPQNVVGVYLPYMVIDANASGEAFGQAEIQTAQYTRKVNDTEQTYYDADIYEVSRRVDFTVDDLTIESSAERANMNAFVNTNNIINAILPFDTKNAVKWNANYLTGFTSEKRDQDIAAIQPVLENQLMSITRSEVAGTLARYDRGVRWEGERLEVHGTRWVSMYLPIWLYSYYHEEGGKGMVHYIAVNGRTGETMGSVPVSHGRLLVAALTAGTVVEGLALGILVATA